MLLFLLSCMSDEIEKNNGMEFEEELLISIEKDIETQHLYLGNAGFVMLKLTIQACIRK